MRPNKAEIKYLDLAYNTFLDIFDEIVSEDFWDKDKYYKFCRIKDAFSLYTELLNYPPIVRIIEYIKIHRPPMEAEIGSELFKFVRNVIAHFPFFQSWEEVWIDKDIVNWYKEGQSIDKFLKKYQGHEPVKFRFWEEDKKRMTYVSITFPKDYSNGERIYLKDSISEKDGIKFSVIFMKRVIDTQVVRG